MKGMLQIILISSVLHFLFGSVSYKGVKIENPILKWFACLLFCTITVFAFGLPILGLMYIIGLL